MNIKVTEIMNAVIGGVIAQILFEAYAWLLSPILFGPELQPANLVMALSQKFVGIGISYEAGYIIHTLIGIFGFAIFTLAFYKLFRGKAILSGLVAGLALWFIAQGILAPAIGREFMMGYGPYTQSSFVGHVGMTMIIALFLKRREA